ncbi:hypothetical protein Q0Z83_041280 [Actinoplanes sichuanensis]|nr:hypothetical protein Q0Z83_041280 [Actinoplanes sichuanensis]
MRMGGSAEAAASGRPAAEADKASKAARQIRASNSRPAGYTVDEMPDRPFLAHMPRAGAA